jgi:hypothetical protein
MPIADFEKAILRLLAANRNPESFVAGATVLLRGETSHRRSQDIDLFWLHPAVPPRGSPTAYPLSGVAPVRTAFD